MNTNMYVIALILFVVGASCQSVIEKDNRIRVIFDTDANNEVDDQHALAYLLFSGDHFDVVGVTVNATSSPDGHSDYSPVSWHYDEAKRVMQLCGVFGKIPLYTGAQASFDKIKEDIDNPDFDGYEAVDFIIEQALTSVDKELVLLPVGKLTNIALALKKEPSIAKNIRIVWLGSNYPAPGEHNQDWDIESMNYILDVDVPFEMVTVRYGEPSGTSAVMVAHEFVKRRMPGKGPQNIEPVVGRHGGEFYNWGDYSVELYSKYGMWGDPKGRALFDMAAVAILKNPEWAENYEISAPIYVNKQWVDRPQNTRKIKVWEWFDIYGIPNDYFETMDNYKIVGKLNDCLYNKNKKSHK